MQELIQLITNFGGFGAMMWALYQQHLMLREQFAHNQALIDKLIDRKNGNGYTNGNGSNNPVPNAK